MDGYFIRCEMKFLAEISLLTNLSWQVIHLLFYWPLSSKTVLKGVLNSVNLSLLTPNYKKNLQIILCQTESKNNKTRRSWPCLAHMRNISEKIMECKDHRNGTFPDSTIHVLPLRCQWISMVKSWSWNLESLKLYPTCTTCTLQTSSLQFHR